MKVQSRCPSSEWSSWSNLETINIQQPQYRLTISAGPGGTTSPQPGDHYYAAGTPVQVTAINYTNYVFGHWLLDENSYDQNPITVPMDSDHTLQAIFSPIEYCLTIQSSYGGYTDPPAGNYYYPYGSYVQVTAYVSDPEYWEWSHWIVDGQPSSTNPTITIPIDGDHTIKPIFVYSPPEYLVVLEGWGWVGAWVPLFGSSGYLPEGSHTLTVPSTYQGLTFVCWYYDGEYRDYGQTSITKWIDSDRYFAALYSM